MPGLTKAQIDELEEEYGLSYALFKAFPELNGLLNQAVSGAWSPAKFQVELRQTAWFKNHSETWRKNIALKFSDPATYNENLNGMISQVVNQATAYGVNLSKKAQRQMAERAMLLGFDEGQIQNMLGAHVKPSKQGEYKGQLASIQAGLESLAYQNGIKILPKHMQRWMQSITRGDATQEQFENHIRNVAAKTFSVYGDQIQGGMNLSDVASPYMQAMAQTLELNPGELDLFDPTIRRALGGMKDDKGQVVPVSVTDFEDQLRRDKRWQFTQGAQQQARGYVTAISRMWGIS